MTLLKILKGWLEIPADLIAGPHECEVVETSHPWEATEGPTPEGWDYRPGMGRWTYRGEVIFVPDTWGLIVVEKTTVWVSSDTHEISEIDPGESWVEVLNQGHDSDPDYEAYRRSWRPVVMLVAKIVNDDGRVMYFQI